MKQEILIKRIASIGLLVGAFFGMAGSFAPTDILRFTAWTVDGIGIIAASALLATYYYRKGMTMTAIGFLVFGIAECFIVGSNDLNLHERVDIFGIGTALWALALTVISSQKTFPIFVRCSGIIAGILFFATTVLIFSNYPIHGLTKPLPFFAYPVFVVTMVGWVFTLNQQSQMIKAQL